MDRDFRTVEDVNEYVYEPDERWAWQLREEERVAIINETLNARYRVPRIKATGRYRRPLNASERNAWARLIGALGGSCAYCCGPGPLSIDHMIPVAAGGRDEMANYAPACKRCNSSKWATDIMTWLEARAAKEGMTGDAQRAWIGGVLTRIRVAQESVGITRARL